jgi:hypothetical protein
MAGGQGNHQLAVVCVVTLVGTGKQFDRLLDGTRTVIQWKEG